MENKNFMTVDEVAQELNVSKSYAYKVVRELNAEMQKLGYLTVTGRVNTNFFRKKLCYSEWSVYLWIMVFGTRVNEDTVHE